MSQNDKSWENSLREETIRSTGTSFGSPKKEGRKMSGRGGSPQHNTESKDYNPMDIYNRTTTDEACIIADPYKPTMDYWVKSDKLTKEEETERTDVNKRNDDIRKMM
jgi:hypothetical protein